MIFEDDQINLHFLGSDTEITDNLFILIKKIITKQMDYYYRVTLIVLVSIAVTGLIAIPFGNPKFIDRAIVLELTFITLSVLLWRRYYKALYACIPLATLVIIGNSLAPPHVNLMMTFSKPLNAIILILGGYVLQGVLIYSSLRAIRNIRSKRLTAST
jgi:hypothetical protein